jgi:hypothetical protein
MTEANVKVRPNIVPIKVVRGDIREYLHGAVRQASERGVRSGPESEWLSRSQLLEWALTVKCSGCGSSSYYCGCEPTSSGRRS